jgi:hypothetical protein
MSDADANEPGDLPTPPEATWNGLPDVDWYQPEPQSQPQAPPLYGGSGYGYGSYPVQSYSRAALVNKPKSNLISGILVTLFCCLPFGIVSIVYAAQVDAKWNAGDWHGAERAARSAKNWALAGLVTGIATTLVYVLILTASGTSTTRY